MSQAVLRTKTTKTVIAAGDHLESLEDHNVYILDSWELHGAGTIAVLFVRPRFGKRSTRRTATPSEFGLVLERS